MARKPKPRTYTAEQKAAALEVLKVDGLAAAARSAGASKSSVIRWARAAGLDPADYADRSTEQNAKAAAAAVAARRATMLEHRAGLSDRLVGELAPKAAAILLNRLDEDAELTDKVNAATEALELAIAALEVAGTPDEDATPEQLKTFAAARKQAVAAVKDAMLVRRAWADARVDVRTLVGVLTRAIGDHLNLEGDLEPLEGGAGSFTVVLTAPRPERGEAVPELVTLPPEPQDARA